MLIYKKRYLKEYNQYLIKIYSKIYDYIYIYKIDYYSIKINFRKEKLILEKKELKYLQDMIEILIN